MEFQDLRFPGYVKLTFILISLVSIAAILYLGQNILIPLFLSLLFAILLRPLVKLFISELNFPHILAVLVSVILFVVSIIAIIVFISWQVSNMTDDWNKIKYNISLHLETFQQWIERRFNVGYDRQQSYFTKVTEETFKSDRESMGNTLNSFTVILLGIVLIPIYTFLILLNRNLFVKFLYKIVGKKSEDKLEAILVQVKFVVRSYLIGLLIDVFIVAILVSTGLMLMGVQYPILLGLITAILNLIPYIGIIAATVISVLATLGNSSDVSVIFGIIALNLGIHLIDINIIVPKIVGNKVRINALASIVGVMIGGALCGIPGMILSIPVTAIIKVIFDNIQSLKPWGFLLGSMNSADMQYSLTEQKLKYDNKFKL